MRLSAALGRARQALAARHIEDAPLESEILLRHALGLSRVQLYLDLDKELGPEQEKLFHELVERRLRGEPSAYITGTREFFSLEFYVNRDVLIPRPETELLVEQAISLARRNRISSIADTGTGCGAIAISLAMHLPGARIYASDVSEEALAVARRNARRHGVEERITWLHGDLLEPLPGPVPLIIANLPYVRKADIDPATFEPRLALDGGEDGLDMVRRLCQQLPDKLAKGGRLLMEIGQGQDKAVVRLLNSVYPSSQPEVLTDLAGIARVVSLSTVC